MFSHFVEATSHQEALQWMSMKAYLIVSGSHKKTPCIYILGDDWFSLCYNVREV